MGRGRRPTPTVLKILRGNPGGRPLPAGEVQPARVLPNAPRWFGDYAKAEWGRMAGALHRLGLLTEIDLAALESYCVLYGRWREAEDLVKEHGLVVKRKEKVGKKWDARKKKYDIVFTERVLKSPYLAAANEALKAMNRVAIEFGLTPSSRAKATRVTGDGEADEFEDFVDGGAEVEAKAE